MHFSPYRLFVLVTVRFALCPFVVQGGVAVKSLFSNRFSGYWSIQTDKSSCFGIHHSMSGMSLSVTVASVKIWGMQCRWCPVKEAPYVLREREDDLKLTQDDLTKLTIDVMPIGTIREFKVGQTFHLVSSCLWTG